jgi:CheY-like chemotaxis protein
MSSPTILVIDDSATIRRLVDGTLSAAGYRVVLAPDAEDGIAKAQSERPNLIILDHQLPGTTGFEVCQKLLTIPELQQTPIVVSSTLRKKAYAEYTDSPNVVDMLPKPYTEELLTTTVANALETGRLIVQSQSDGTAVPEVVHAVEDADVSGSFKVFSLREVLDFLNNSAKTGALEVEAGGTRVSYYLNDGRIQAVVGNGVDVDEIMNTVPESLGDLAPVLKLTVAGRMCSEIDGLVELLDRKVLDPRLLRSVLRHQAAMLAWTCFRTPLKAFRFESGRVASPLFSKLPLDASLASLLVEAALRCDESQLPRETADTYYSRRTLRGQNLDRAGLTAHQMRVLSAVTDPQTADEIATKLGVDVTEIRRVLQGLAYADLIERQVGGKSHSIVVLDDDATTARNLRKRLDEEGGRYAAKIVRDQLAVQLLLKRSRPDALIMPMDTEPERKFALSVHKHLSTHQEGAPMWIGLHRIGDQDETNWTPPIPCDAVLPRSCDAEEILSQLDRLFNNPTSSTDDRDPAGESAAVVTAS